MKKTLLALAVFAAAGSAQAIEVYNQDGVTVNFQGDFEFRYVKSQDEDSNLKMEVNDADLGFDVRYAVNDDFSVGGYVQYQADDGDVINGKDKSGVKGGNAYVGFYTAEMGSLKLGKLDIQLDDMGVGSDEIFGIDSYISDLEAGGNEAVRYDLDKGNFYIGASFLQAAQEQNPNTGKLPRDHNWDVRGGVRVADFDFTGYYGESGEASLVAAEARFAGIENVNLELGYYLADDGSDDVNSIAFAADYSMNAWGFGAGVASHDADADDLVQWFANVTYKLAPNTKVYTEIGGNDADDSEVGYGFGIEASF